MKLTLAFALLCTLLCPFTTMEAQNQKYSTNQKNNKQNVDKDGTPYYLDKEGYPYYINKNGEPYYIDNYGSIYYLDNKGIPYYLDQKGMPFYYDKNDKPFYYNQNGEIVYYNLSNSSSERSISSGYNSKKIDNSSSKEYNSNSTANNKVINSYNNYKKEVKPVDEDTPDKFRLTLGGGYTYKFDVLDVYDDISNNGYNLDADIQYFFNEIVGIGVTANYSYFKHLNESDQKLTYIAPGIVLRSMYDKFSFIYNINIGALFLKERTNIDTRDQLDYKETLFAVGGSISGEYKLGKNLGLGLKLSCTFSDFDSYYEPGFYYNGHYHPGYYVNGSETFRLATFNLTAFLSFRAK